MCAIFGIIGRANLNLIKEISNKQIFRGPDEQNFFVSSDNLVSLGNNRLSVIDKKNGGQPMHSQSKRYVTVFNGCIYNFLEIKEFLRSKKINFKTNCDTEVVANAFEYFGDRAFNYFDGMWAIAIYDQEKKEIILSRDYVGQKPLYYSRNNNYHIFSSDISGIFIDNQISTNVSLKNIKKYFAYSHVPAPHTIFENIFQVEPGENIYINSSNLNLTSKKYWDLKNGPDYNIFFKKNEINTFKDNFEKIIKEHSIADNTPALSLSGGIDSYIIMEYLIKTNKEFSSFTLGFENETFDEARFVKKINKEIKKEIFYADNNELKDNLLEISERLSDPLGDSSLIPTYIIQKKIKKYSNVSIGGDGGDESFFGYITFDAFILASIIKKFIPNFIFKLLSKLINLKKISFDYLTFSTKIRKFLSSIHLKKKYLLPSWMGCLNTKDMSVLFNENINEENLYECSNKLFTKNFNLMRYSQLYYYKFYLPMILKKIDNASMFNSVESRSPFLSKKIINFSLDQDISTLYKFFNKKYFLKKSFKNIIPKEIMKRKKHGFAFPKETLLRDEKLMERLLDYNILINKKFFMKKYKNFLNKTDDCSQYLWNELVLNLTLQNFYKVRPSIKN